MGLMLEKNMHLFRTKRFLFKYSVTVAQTTSFFDI